MSNDLFSTVVESLLAGKVICRYTSEREYEFLSDEDNLRQIGDYLWKIKRRIRCTTDENGYLLAHLEQDSHRAKQEAKWIFDEMCNHIRPVIHWLALTRRCDPMGSPLKAGDILRESELMSAIEDMQEVTRDLDNLCRIKPFQNENRSPKGQLSRVLNKLVDMGYLVPIGPNKLQYRATARLSLFYDMLDFVRDHEGIEEGNETSDNTQMELNS